MISHIKPVTMTKLTDILVLGNGPQINDIKFYLIKPHIITLGVNRIWLAYVPNFLFFHDPDIIYEIMERPDVDFSKTVLITSDWLKESVTSISNRFKAVYSFPRVNRSAFPDSVTTAIQLFAVNLMPDKNLRFYIAGVNLKWTEPSHFWKRLNHKGRNNLDSTWYKKRFSLMLVNFQYLTKLGYEMENLTPDSMLSRILRGHTINHIYLNENSITEKQ